MWILVSPPGTQISKFTTLSLRTSLCSSCKHTVDLTQEGFCGCCCWGELTEEDKGGTRPAGFLKKDYINTRRKK